MKSITERKPKAVLDTSVMIAGILSPFGGSGKIIEACQRGIILCGVSSSSYTEIERNIEKFPSNTLVKFTELVNKYFKEIRPSSRLVDSFSQFVDPDDAHLLAVSKNWKADFLVSLNRKHLVENPQAQKASPAKIVSPKELIRILGL